MSTGAVELVEKDQMAVNQLYVQFHEHNPIDEETWHFYIPAIENEENIHALSIDLADMRKAEIIDHVFSFHLQPKEWLTENEVDNRIASSRDFGCVNRHVKLEGMLDYVAKKEDLVLRKAKMAVLKNFLLQVYPDDLAIFYGAKDPQSFVKLSRVGNFGCESDLYLQVEGNEDQLNAMKDDIDNHLGHCLSLDMDQKFTFDEVNTLNRLIGRMRYFEAIEEHGRKHGLNYAWRALYKGGLVYFMTN